MFTALKKLYRNTLFRLSLLGAILFVIALFIALGNVYFLTISSEIRRVDRELSAEIAELQSVITERGYQDGIITVGREVILRSVAADRGYIMVTRSGDGQQVEVGNLSDAERVKSAIWTSSAIALFLGLISSWFVSRRFTRRVEAFNRLATDVRAGQLDRRAPRNYSEDEMDLLAEHLNAMLDHIDRLMKAMR